MSKRPSLSLAPRHRCAAAVAAALLASSLAHAQGQPPVPTPGPAAEGQASPRGAAGQRDAARNRGTVTLNFVNAEIDAVTRAMGAMLDRQFIVDPRVKGNITVYSEQPLTVREAYLNYLAALRGLGFTVVENAGLLKVVPEADAKLQAGTVSIGAPTARGDTIQTQIFRLTHENPNNLVAVLRPLISPNNTINANPSNSSLVITDYADNLQRIARIIAALDQPASTDLEVIPLQHALAADLAPLVQRLGDGSALPGAPGVPVGAAAGGAATVLADARSNSLIIRAANPARLAQLRSIIEKLDLPSAAGGGNLWVVPLKNADAVKLATVLRAAFGSGGGAGGGAGGGGGGGAPGGFGATSQTTSLGSTAAGGAGQSSAATAPLAASAQPSTGGFIQADPSTNSLIITAPEPLYRQVRAMIDQLDSRRAQIYIESLIVEVAGDNAADVGFQWQGMIGKDGDKNIGVIGTNLGQSRTPSIIDITTAAASGAVAVGSGLNIGLVRNFGGQYALAAIAQFLQTQTNTNIMSTPNLITLDNEEAKIVVGRNVPFITGQFTSTGTGTTNPFQTIERKDVGLTLRIKPQIGEGGTVRMTIFQESSDVITQATGTQNTGPTTSKRSIESSVIVDDGQILVLGGLIEDRYEENNTKVPLLGDIPMVGGLFRSESRTKRRTNLMVFLRPVVMRTADQANRITLDRYDIIRAQQKDAQPVPNLLLPVQSAPVLPPMPVPAASAPAANVTPPDPSKAP